MESSDAPDLSRFRCLQAVRMMMLRINYILITSESSLRIVCAMVAFGMGLDCTDVCMLVHLMTWHPTSKKQGEERS